MTILASSRYVSIYGIMAYVLRPVLQVIGL
jgi:hypothetical protein